MKGSPILATALACLIMLGMYVGMRVAFSENNASASQARSDASSPSTNTEIPAYVEIYFSSSPRSFTLTHPATGTELIKVADLENGEWDGNIVIPVEKLTTIEFEILGKVEWQSPDENYHFMQVVISPDNLDPQTQTLRAQGDILDVMNFQWKEGK